MIFINSIKNLDLEFNPQGFERSSEKAIVATHGSVSNRSEDTMSEVSLETAEGREEKDRTITSNKINIIELFSSGVTTKRGRTTIEVKLFGGGGKDGSLTP